MLSIFHIIDEYTVCVGGLSKSFFDTNDDKEEILKHLITLFYVDKFIEWCKENNINCTISMEDSSFHLLQNDKFNKDFEDSYGLYLNFEKSEDLIYYKLSNL